MRISTPVYFASCSADAVFDLDTFLSSVERSGKWKCPHTGRLCNSGELQVGLALNEFGVQMPVMTMNPEVDRKTKKVKAVRIKKKVH